MNAATSAYVLAHRETPAAELADLLTADPYTARNIPAREFVAFLNVQGRYRRLKATITHPACPGELVEGIEELLWFLATGPEYVGTGDSRSAQRIHDALDGLVELYVGSGGTLGLPEADMLDLIELGGGLRYERLTPEQVEACWAEEDARATALAAAAEADARLASLRYQVGRAYNAVVGAVDAGERDLYAVAAVFAASLEA